MSEDLRIIGVMRMVSRAFQTCQVLVEEMVKQRYFPQINEAMVKRLIMKHVGADMRTVQKYMRLLCDFDFLIPEDRGKIPNYRERRLYRLNLSKVDVKQLTLVDVKKL